MIDEPTLTEAQKQFLQMDFEYQEFRNCLMDILDVPDFVSKMAGFDYMERHSGYKLKGKYLKDKRAELKGLILSHPALRSRDEDELTMKLKYFVELQNEFMKQMKANQRTPIPNRTPKVEDLDE
jgi:hypothetical protein